MKLDALVAPLRRDVVSGAAVVGRTAAEVVRRAAVRVPAEEVEEFRARIGELAHHILDAQPAMAPLVHLGRTVLEALDGAESVEEARRLAARAAESFRTDGDARMEAVAERVADHLPHGGAVLTISNSSTVRATLERHADERELRVICLESRPVNEGQGLARSLALAGISVTYAVDGAAARMVERADVVLMGADSVGDGGIVNKIGSELLAREARRVGVPVVVATDSTKLLPPGFPQPVADDRPASEVWRAPGGVRIWNRYFERIPTDLADVVVTDSEALRGAGIDERRRSLTVPPELASWAERRTA